MTIWKRGEAVRDEANSLRRNVEQFFRPGESRLNCALPQHVNQVRNLYLSQTIRMDG